MGGLGNPGQLNWRDESWPSLLRMPGGAHASTIDIERAVHVANIGKPCGSRKPEVYRMQPQQESIEYRYATALHWSLTQFTPATVSRLDFIEP